MLNRNKRVIGYCRALQEGDEGYTEGLTLFAPPVYRLLNVLPYSGENVLAFASTIRHERYKARYHPQQQDKYYKGDRLFLFAEVPSDLSTFDPLNPGADATVEAVEIGKRTVELVIEMLAAATEDYIPPEPCDDEGGGEDADPTGESL